MIMFLSPSLGVSSYPFVIHNLSLYLELVTSMSYSLPARKTDSSHFPLQTDRQQGSHSTPSTHANGPLQSCDIVQSGVGSI